MSTQVAVRLPDDLVEFLDLTVKRGEARSRAQVVAEALERERGRRQAEHDVAVLLATGPDPELDAIARHAAATPLAGLD